MRQLYHPSLDEITVEGILHALADPVRIKMYAHLSGATCPQNCSTVSKGQEHPVAKSTLSGHFRILREAGLIHSERVGTEMINSTRAEELEERFGPMIKAIIGTYVQVHKSQTSA